MCFEAIEAVLRVFKFIIYLHFPFLSTWYVIFTCDAIILHHDISLCMYCVKQKSWEELVA